MPHPDPAASIVALRPTRAGFEVLIVHRNSRGYFRDIAVFPGGKVEDIDVPPGLSTDDDLSHRNAALREFAEETGILITADGAIAVPEVKDAAFYEWLSTGGVTPGVDRLVLVSRWVTPDSAPRRFDARFYVVGLADPPEVVIDADELIGYAWVTPEDALTRSEGGEWAMITPTTAHLRWLRRRSSIEEAINSARGADGRSSIVPRMVEDGSLLPVHMPAEVP